MRVLVVEDDLDISDEIEEILTAENIVCEVTDSGEDALELAKLYDFDIVLLDLILPDVDGHEVVRRLRTAKVETPVLILSSLGEIDDKVRGLTYGADDYLVKPFDKSELLARIQAIVRRSQGHAQPLIQTGRLVVNLETQTAAVDDQPVHLTGKEYGILELLSLRKGNTLTKEMFLNHLYGGIDEPELKIIDVFVCKLRKKIAAATGGETYIDTVWGRGYTLKDLPGDAKPVEPQKVVAEPVPA